MMQVTNEAFTPVLGEGNLCEPSAIYVGALTDQGGNIINTFTRMGVPLGICSGHREGTCVTWALEISGTERAVNRWAGSCVELDCKKRISKVTAMAGVFNHSVCNNDELKEIQLEVLELDQALDLVRRNDTRYEGDYCLVHKRSMLLADVSLCSCMNGTRSLGSWLQLELSFRRTHE